MHAINKKHTNKNIDINIDKQQLTLFQADGIVAQYPISTAKNGVGQVNGSECTPLGDHIVDSKIGINAKINTVFIGREESGEIFTDDLKKKNPERDWILTRIIWLSGMELGKNKGGEVDTMRRYIYIHGCPDSDSFSFPSSHGCVKMRNEDIIALFENIKVGTHVLIH